MKKFRYEKNNCDFKKLKDEWFQTILFRLWDGVDIQEISKLMNISWEQAENFVEAGKEDIEKLFFKPSTKI